MSTETTWQVESDSSEQTEQLGQQLGQALKGGEAIELISDLGGGKTTFVRGLVRGAKSHDKVASPTFTISKVYDAEKFAIHHFDFYRLAEPGIVADELAEVLGDPKIITVVEWGGIVQHVMPQNRLTIKLVQTPTDTREITFCAPESLKYLLEALK